MKHNHEKAMKIKDILAQNDIENSKYYSRYLI
jgi:hypothetical protein